MHKDHVGAVTFVSCCLVGVEYEVEKVYALQFLSSNGVGRVWARRTE
jgi:hypothetical protein